MSASRTPVERGRSRDEYYESRSRRPPPALRDHRATSPHRHRQQGFDPGLRPGRKDSKFGGGTSRRTKYPRRDLSEEGRPSSRQSSPLRASPHRAHTDYKRSTRSRHRAEEQVPHERKHRHHPPKHPKRQRSCSASPSGANFRKHRRTESRSPHESSSPLYDVPHRRRDRTRSLAPSAHYRVRPSRKRKYADDPRRRYPERSLSPPRQQRRPRSPLRSRPTASTYRERSPVKRWPTTEARDTSAAYLSSRRVRRGRSPERERGDWDKESRWLGEEHPEPITSDEHRAYTKGYRRRRSPRPREARDHLTTRSGRASPEPLHRRASAREDSGAASPSKRADPGSRPRSRASPDIDRRADDDTMYMRPAYSSYSARPSGYRSRERFHASPTRPPPPHGYPEYDERRHYDDIRAREGYPAHSYRVPDGREPPRMHSRPSLDTRAAYSPAHQYMTPTSAHPISPQAASPYANGRHWGGQHSPYHGQPS